MTELETRLNRLSLRLDHTGMRVEQAVLDALEALANGDVSAGEAVNAHDVVIDREEVEVEQECIRLLALYQPAAIDLRTLCTIIKVNSDLERIADLGAAIGRGVKHAVRGNLELGDHPAFNRLRQGTVDILGRTARMLSAGEASNARRIIELDSKVDEEYRMLIQDVLAGLSPDMGDSEAVLTILNLAKALERIGDLCTNIAEDIIFLRTGDIVRHSAAFGDNDV